MEINIEEAEKYLDFIDVKYFEAKKNGMSRFDVKWGVWSVVMNRELRNKEKENPLLVSVFMYWVAASQLLQLCFKHKVLKNLAKKKLRQEMESLKNRIKEGIAPEESIQEFVIKGIKK